MCVAAKRRAMKRTAWRHKMPKRQTDIEALIDTNEVARVLGTTQAAVAQMRVRNVGPPFIKLGRSVRYDPITLRE